eukprot:892570-Amphidinium_carterae.1
MHAHTSQTDLTVSFTWEVGTVSNGKDAVLYPKDMETSCGKDDLTMIRAKRDAADNGQYTQIHL